MFSTRFPPYVFPYSGVDNGRPDKRSPINLYACDVEILDGFGNMNEDETTVFLKRRDPESGHTVTLTTYTFNYN